MRIWGILLLVFIFQGCLSQENESSKRKVIGVLLYSRHFEQSLSGLRDGLARLGLHEGEDVTYAVASLGGDPGRFSTAYGEVMQQKPDVLFTTTTLIAREAKKLLEHSHIPVLFNAVADPLEENLVLSMDAPGVNMTGVSHVGNRLIAKRLELLADCFPATEKTLIFLNSAVTYTHKRLAFLEPVAREMGITLEVHYFKDRNDLERITEELKPDARSSVYILPDPAAASNIDVLINFSRKGKIPLMVHDNSVLARGGSLGYSPSFYGVGFQTAQLVQMLFSGIPASRIPVQYPDVVELVFNDAEIQEYGIPFNKECRYYSTRIMR